jgi:uncharacterized protein YdhG (YjbR/CyaY superfamily)
MQKEIKEYHLQFESATQKKLKEMHDIIKEVLPDADEIISYKMPAFKMKQVLVYYAGYAHHIGFYPTSKPIVQFKDELSAYKHSKGAVQFPLEKPLPKRLIQAMVMYRLKNL